MTTMTVEAQDLFDEYLQRVRWSVRGIAGAAEIERDIREHVASALEQHQEEPVSSRTLRDVLTRLGEPWQWVPAEELPLWRRVLMRFSVGPEDWRLAYLCLALSIAGIVLIPFGGFLLLIAAWLLARATYDLASDRDRSLGPRRWLVYPILAFFAFIVVVATLVAPVAPLIAWTAEPGFAQVVRLANISIRDGMDRSIFQFAVGAVLAGVWCVLMSGLVSVAIRPFRWMVLPFANRLRRVHLFWVAGFGAAVAGVGAAAMAFVR